MTGLLKEIGKRVSLYDIVQQAEEADKLVEAADKSEKYILKAQYLTRHASRVMFRMIGNIDVALAGYLGYNAASVDPEQVPMCVLLGIGGVLTYLADYTLFDRINPLK